MWYLLPAENFPNTFFALLFTVLFFVIVIVELRIFHRDYLSGKSIYRDRGSLLCILVSVVVAIGFLFWGGYAGMGRISGSFLSYIGFFVVLLGFAIRQWAIHVLGRSFSPIVSVEHTQILETSGLYHHIRHPGYLGLLLELGGAALAVSNVLIFALILLILLPSILYRIAVEERLLEEHFGEEYKSYKARTKKLCPFVF